VAGSQRALGVRQRSTLRQAVEVVELSRRAVRRLEPGIWIGLHLPPGEEGREEEVELIEAATSDIRLPSDISPLLYV